MTAARSSRFVPVDLLFVVSFVAVVSGVVVASLGPPVLGPLLGLPFLLFVPGYVLVALLFPGRGRARRSSGGSEARWSTFDWPERLALSVGVSLVVLPFLGLLIAPAGYAERTVVLALAGFVLAAAVGAAIRRARLPAAARLRVPRPRPAFARPSAGRVATVVLALGIVFAAGSLAYAVAAPNAGETYSSIYVGTGTGSELVASEYPTEFTAGESGTVAVGVENAERQQVEYTVVAELQRVSAEGDALTVLQEQELGRFTPTIDAGETWRYRHTFVPELTGAELRVQYHLYRGAAPTDPNAGSAYRTVSLWIDVSGDA